MVTSAADAQVWPEGRKRRLRELIAALYRVVSDLELEFEGRRFTPDGHLVGSIGEVVAAYAFNLRLLPASNATHHAIAPDGRFVQIKLTGGNSGVSLYSAPQHLLVLQLFDNRFQAVYNGPGSVAWERCGNAQKNGQRSISLAKLRDLDSTETDKIPLVNPFPELDEAGTHAPEAEYLSWGIAHGRNGRGSQTRAAGESSTLRLDPAVTNCGIGVMGG